MSFGSGKVQYTISVEDAQAASKIKSVSDQFKTLGSTTQSASQQMNQMPETFQTIVQEGNKVTTTTKQVQQTMQGTVTTVTTATKAHQSFGEVLKNNVLSITVAASSIVGLISQYTSLRKAQIAADRAAVVEQTTRNRVIDLTNKLAATIQKYGANSSQAAKGARDLQAAQEKAAIAADRNEVIQASLNERIADFAINILPNVIGAVGSVIQVIQGLRGAEEVSTVTTIENTGAQVANATAMKLSGGAATGLVGPLKGVAVAEVGVGNAAKVAGTSMRTALIRTGIGAIIVAIGTALVAFTQNWYGFRDAVNNAGVELGKFMPILIPILNGLKFFGDILNKMFGTDIPDAAAEAGDAMEAGMKQGSAAAKEASEWAKKVSDSWQKIQEPFLKLIGDHKWKQLIKDIKELGFSAGAAKKIKVGLDVTFEAKDILKNLQTSLSFISEFHLNKKDTQAWAKNTIGDMKDAIKEHPELKGILQPIIDIIKANKNDPQGMTGAIADLLTNDTKISAALQQLGIDLEPEVAKIGSSWGEQITTNMDAIIKQFNPTNNPLTFLTMNKDDMTKQALGLGGAGTQPGTDFATNFITGFKAGMTNVAGTLDTAITSAMKGLDIVAQLAGIKNAAMFSQGWLAFKEFGGQVGAWITSAWAEISPTLTAIGAGAAGFFSAGWQTATEGANAFSEWVTKTWAEISPTITAIGQGAAGFFTIGWQNAVEGSAAFSDWVTKTWTEISPTLTAIGTGAAGLFTEGWKAFTDLGTQLNTWIADAQSVTIPVVQGIGAGAAAYFAAGWKSFKDLGTQINDWIAHAQSVTIPVITGIGAGAASYFVTGWKTLKDAGTQIGTWLSNQVNAAWQSFKDIGTAIGKQVVFGIGDFVNQNPIGKAIFGQGGPLGGPQEAFGQEGAGHKTVTGQTLAPFTPPTTPSQINLQNTQAMAVIKATANAITDLTVILPQINLQNKQAMAIITKTANAVTDLTAIEPAINLQNKQAMKIITNTANAITDLTTVEPQINLQNKNAMKIITKTANAITDLTAVKPQINLQNKNAMKVITKTSNAITDLTNTKPQINLQNSDALKTISATDKKIKALSQTVTITTNHINKVKTVMVAKGFHGVVNSPMNFTAGESGPELVNVTPLSGSRSANTNSTFLSRSRGGDTGGDGGDLTVNNVIDLGDSRIIRSFKRKLGSDRYTFGG